MNDQRKLESAALLLAIFGATLMVPPLINVFNVPKLFFGAPAGVTYLFVVWIGLIAVTAWISGRVQDRSAERDDAPSVSAPTEDND